ncbi:MAG: hypothetical protein GXY41_11770 [Phycisphaerae bacterium]|nr:hypothetical protein [Phycisphaerae bacterium]
MNKDIVHNAFKWMDHNRYAVASVIAFIVAMGFVLNLTGCEAMTHGLANGDTTKVTRTEFQRQALGGEKDLAVRRIELDAEIAAFNEEIKLFNQRVEAGQDDLARQEAFKQQLLDTVGLVAVSAAESTLNPAALIPIGIGLLGGALGIGTAADNRRKDQVITTLKTAPSAPVAT